MENSQQEPTKKASTQEVLGTAPSGEMKIDPQWQKSFRALNRLRESLVNRQRDLLSQAAEEVTPPQRDVADLGTDDYDRDWALSMASSEQELLYEIDGAIRRMQDGSYGICELTGQPIEPERLEAIPWTRFSADAEKRLEAEGKIRTARLSPREGIPKETQTQPVEEEQHAG